MCGIVGYTGNEQVLPLLVESLKTLEYRGYDSAGVSVLDDGKIVTVRAKGKIAYLEDRLHGDLEMTPELALRVRCGLGHTRWATHGSPSEQNAHPHVDCVGRLVLVHNGIIENYIELKEELQAKGHKFSSKTDTEVIVHLIEEYYCPGELKRAIAEALKRVTGAFALGVMCVDEPDTVIGVRYKSPLVFGVAEGGHLICSDIVGVLSVSQDVIYLEDYDLIELTCDSYKIYDYRTMTEVQRKLEHVNFSRAAAEKGGYEHFMLKEIFEQPQAVEDTITGRVIEDSGSVCIDGVNLRERDLCNIKRIVIIACGTSLHAGLVGKFLLEKYARIPVEVDYASEYRYRDPIVDKDTMVLAISQSGETADTLAAVEEAKAKGAYVLAICNVTGSSIPRASHGTLYTHAGPEVGVASTKCFTTQLAAMHLLSLHIAKARGRLSQAQVKAKIRSLRSLPKLMVRVLEQADSIKELAHSYFEKYDYLFIARGPNYPIALESALKLKEISYLHAEGYPAGEMKHGPISLISDDMPVVALVPQGVTREKVLANIEEVKARGGRVIAVASDGDSKTGKLADHTIYVPLVDEDMSPLLTVIPMQLFAYYIAVFRGCNVDQPRNLAKSVTVE